MTTKDYCCKYHHRPTVAKHAIKDHCDGEIHVCDDHYNEHVVLTLWEFMTEGRLPPGFVDGDGEPFEPLEGRRAFRIIYMLQEFVGVIPDSWEFCNDCGRLFNSENEHYVSLATGMYCENCAGSHGENCERCSEGVPTAEIIEIDELPHCQKCAAEWWEHGNPEHR